MASFIVVTIIRGRFRSTGHLTPGNGLIRVSTAGVFADVAPGNNSLAILVGTQEPKTTKWFRVKPGEIVIDVGAHIGRYSLIAAKDASTVVSIEPDPYNFAMLESNIRLNGFRNVVLLQKAVSNHAGRRQFYVAGGGDTGTSSLEPSWSWSLDTELKRKQIVVECETLDSILDGLGFEQIDWLKIDVEGHEIPVLEGASASLTRARTIILEVAEGNEKICGELVRGAGFELVAIDRGKKEAGLRASSNWLLRRTNN